MQAGGRVLARAPGRRGAPTPARRRTGAARALSSHVTPAPQGAHPPVGTAPTPTSAVGVDSPGWCSVSMPRPITAPIKPRAGRTS